MERIITIFLALGLSAYGMSYEKFKKYTQKNAKVLQKQALLIQTTQETNNILLRTQNPILGLEASRFNPQGADSSFQYAGSITQTIRTVNYYHGLEEKAHANTLLQQAYVLDGKAAYMRSVENLYTSYVYQSKLLTLLEEEYTLSKKVTAMVKQRYQNGSQNKVAYLQEKTDTLLLKTEMSTTKQEMNTLYYQLLSIAGMTKKVSLQKQFIYPISSLTQTNSHTNPKQQILQAKEKLLESHISMNESSIESYELYSSIEDEPDQSILRLGISIPLPIFNDKSEEKMLAKLQKEQLNLDKEQLEIDIFTKKKMIKSSIKELNNQYQALKVLKKEQQLLNDLLQEGYQIAQGSIFMLMTAKNRLIQTQKSLLQTEKNINHKKIDLRFIQGDYND